MRQKRGQHGRDEVAGANLLRADDVGQPRRIAVRLRRRDHQGAAGDQRQEELPHRHVEGGWRLLQDAVVRVKAVVLPHPFQPVDDGAVLDHHALGLAGGAGGVDHVGGVRRRDVGVQRCSGACIRPVAGGPNRHVAWQQRLRVRLGQDAERLRQLRDARQPFPGVRKIQGQVGRASAQHGDQRDQQIQRARQCHSHQRAAARTAFAQCGGQAAAALIQLGVGQAVTFEFERGRIWPLGHLRFDQRRQCGVGHRVVRSVVLEQVRTGFCGAGQWHIVHGAAAGQHVQRRSQEARQSGQMRLDG